VLLYDAQRSGNCYKVRLMLARTGIRYERREISVTDRSDRENLIGRTANPALRVPTLHLDDGRFLAESCAIIWFLAEGTPMLPADAFERAQVLQWMFFEQYEHEPNIAVARFWLHLGGQEQIDPMALAAKQEGGRRALQAMELHLSTRAFFVAERFTIADISLYAYTHVADEAGIDMRPYPAIAAWLERVAAQPGHITIDD
jgi:glutathione S-transferase